MAETEAIDAWIRDAEQRGAIAVLTHKNGDLDTVGSAQAIALALGPAARACGVHVSRPARRLLGHHLLEHRPLSSTRTQWPRQLGGVIIVDAAGPSQTGVDLPDAPRLILDHHSAGEGWAEREGDLIHISEATSTAEIVAKWLQTCRTEIIDHRIASLLLAGVIADTGHFRHADASALRCAATLSEHLDETLAVFIERMQENVHRNSERIGILTSLQRAEITQVGDMVVAHCRSGPHEGAVATNLVRAGADIAVAHRTTDEGQRLTCRARHAAVQNGVHLGTLCEHLAKTRGGEGGGHAGAAGWTAVELKGKAAVHAFLDELARGSGSP